jgi:hypothetical protein
MEVEVHHIAVIKSCLKAHAEDEKIKRWLIIYMPSQSRHVRGTETIAEPMSRNPAVNADRDILDNGDKRIFDENMSTEYPLTSLGPGGILKSGVSPGEHKEDCNSLVNE